MTIDEALNLAAQHRAAGNPAEAEHLYRQILAGQPAHAHALLALGAMLQAAGRGAEAVSIYRTGLAIDPSPAEVWSNLGIALIGLGQFNDAADACRRALAINSRSGPAHSNLAISLFSQGDVEGAAAEFRRAAELSPDLPEAHTNLAMALAAAHRPEEAAAAYRQALRLQPDNARTHYQLGLALHIAADLPGSVAALRAAVERAPEHHQAWCALGRALSDAGHFDDAVACLRRAVELKPDFAEARMELGLSLLRLGDFQNGWPEYDFRWRIPQMYVSPLKFPTPPWEGEDLTDKRIVLHAEQGWGDAIQFIRFAPLVRRRGGKTIFYGPPQLFRLCGAAQGIDECVDWTLSPTFQAHCPLLNLPRVFKTDLTNIPASVPYLSADPALSRQWRDRLAAGDPSRLKIGLCWAGRPEHLRDRQRSIPLAALASLWDVPHARFVSLQKGAAAGQVRSVAAPLTDWSAELNDLADTAALIDNLDLVITVDTLVAHLAGALAKPVWVLLPFVPDWRWMLDRADSPWYPTMRLFRQKSRGDWLAPIAEVLAALRLL